MLRNSQKNRDANVDKNLASKLFAEYAQLCKTK